MDYLGQPFYVGLLSAAALHGAAHQQPQQFHVVTTGLLRDMRSNGLAIRFFSKSRFADVPLTRIKVQTGHIPASTPEATALDLIRYARRIGGLARVLTVLQELGEVMNQENLAKAAMADEKVAHVQRLGYLLERAGFSSLTGPLFQWGGEQRPLKRRVQ